MIRTYNDDKGLHVIDTRFGGREITDPVIVTEHVKRWILGNGDTGKDYITRLTVALEFMVGWTERHVNAKNAT